MKGAYLLTFDRDLIGKVTEVAGSAECPAFAKSGLSWADDRHVMLVDDETGGQLLIYRAFGDGLDWDFRDPPHSPIPGVTLPDMETVLGYMVECRWEEQFARTVREIAHLVDGGARVLDGDGVVWDATAVDPDRVRL